MRIILSIITITSAGMTAGSSEMTLGEKWVTGSTIALTIVTVLAFATTIWAVVHENNKTTEKMAADQQRTTRLMIRAITGILPGANTKAKHRL